MPGRLIFFFYARGSMTEFDPGTDEDRSNAGWASMPHMACPATGLANNEYQHVALVVNGSKLAFYRGGQLVCLWTVPDPLYAVQDCTGGTIRVGGVMSQNQGFYSLCVLGAISP
jgi:hypothetical protein